MKRKRLVMERPHAERAQEMMKGNALSREVACTRKQAYDSRNDARHAAKGAAKYNERPFSIYHCTYCGKWHITKFKHGEDDE